MVETSAKPAKNLGGRPSKAQLLAKEQAALLELQACIEEEKQLLAIDKAQNPGLTDQEQRFIDYFQAGHSKRAAMRLANYQLKHESNLNFKANKILAKRDSLVADKRVLLRELGITESAIAQGIWTIAQNAIHDKTKLDALALLAKIFGLTVEQVEQAVGVQILITGTGEQVQLGQAGSTGTPTAIEVEPVKVRMIK